MTSTSLHAVMISGPIPSPGRRVIWYLSFLETALRDEIERVGAAGANALVLPAASAKAASVAGEIFIVDWIVDLLAVD